jgi:hypothetical protein
MKERICCIGKKILSKLLVLLGFSTTFVFMACYGPRPNYAPVDFDDTDSISEVDSVSADSTIVNTEQSK